MKPTKVRGSPVAAFAAVWSCTIKPTGGELATALFHGNPTEEDDGSDRAIEQAILGVLIGHQRYHRCDSKRVRLDVIEPLVWQGITNAFNDDKQLREGVAERGKIEAKTRRVIEQNLAATQAQLQKAQGQLDRLLDLYTNGDLDHDTYLAKRRKIESGTDDLKASLADLHRRFQSATTVLPDGEASMRRLRELASDRLTPDTTFPAKRRLIEALQLSVIYNHETGDVTANGLIGKLTLSVLS